MLDSLVGGFGHGYGHKDQRSSGYGFEEHKEFNVSHAQTGTGHFDRQSRYEHVRLPANHGRQPMAHMPAFDEDSDGEFFESSYHTTVLPQHGNNHHNQPPHMTPMGQPHRNGHTGNGWYGQHGGQGVQNHGGYGKPEYGGHGMQQHGTHGTYQGGYGMQHQGAHGMQHQGAHGMQNQGAYGVKHQGMLMAHSGGHGREVVVKAENYRVSSGGGGHQKAGWGSKGL